MNKEDRILILLEKIGEKLEIDLNEYLSIPCRNCKKLKLISEKSYDVSMYVIEHKTKCLECGYFDSYYFDKQKGWFS